MLSTEVQFGSQSVTDIGVDEGNVVVDLWLSVFHTGVVSGVQRVYAGMWTVKTCRTICK